MEQAEAMEARCKDIEEERKAFRIKFEEDQQAIQKEMAVLTQDLETYVAENKRIRKQVDESVLKKYDHIKAHKEGIGLSPVVKGVCQGCHMGIPPQKFNELMRGDELMNCPHCRRIIYWGEDERYK